MKLLREAIVGALGTVLAAAFYQLGRLRERIDILSAERGRLEAERARLEAEERARADAKRRVATDLRADLDRIDRERVERERERERSKR